MYSVQFRHAGGLWQPVFLPTSLQGAIGHARAAADVMHVPETRLVLAQGQAALQRPSLDLTV